MNYAMCVQAIHKYVFEDLAVHLHCNTPKTLVRNLVSFQNALVFLI